MEAILGAIRAFASKIWDAISAFFKWWQDAFDYLWELLTDFPAYVFSQLCESLVAFVNSLPVPSFVHDAAAAFQGIPSSVLFFLDALAVGPGLSMILLAYVLRFLIRRIPVIG